MNVLKRFFFVYGAYIEKWGLVFWGESNKEEFLLLFIFYYYCICFVTNTVVSLFFYIHVKMVTLMQSMFGTDFAMTFVLIFYHCYCT